MTLFSFNKLILFLFCIFFNIIYIEILVGGFKMKNKLLISILGLSVILGGCSEEVSEKEDTPVSEEEVTENTSEVIEGVVENYSSDEKIINIQGETYDFSRVENAEELATAEEISIEYVTEENVNYITSFQVLKTKTNSVETPVTQEARGTFVGWSDVHAIAINVNDEEMIFQTTWFENEDELNNIAENDTVNFEYVEEEGIYYITKMLIGEDSSLAEFDATGTFIGWADNHTVLMDESGEEVSYQINRMDDYAKENNLTVGQINQINDGAEVSFTYTEDEGVRYLLSIEGK